MARSFSHSRTFMDSPGVQAKGFQEVGDALKRMGQYAKKGYLKDLRYVGQASRRLYREKIRSLFTMRTGNLLRSITFAVNPSASTLLVGPRRKGFYAFMLLYGTKTKEGTQRIKPTPFLDPVGEQSQEIAAEMLGNGWLVEWGGR